MPKHIESLRGKPPVLFEARPGVTIPDRIGTMLSKMVDGLTGHVFPPPEVEKASSVRDLLNRPGKQASEKT